MPLAPAKFEAEFHLTRGRTQQRMLNIDWLAQPDTVLRARGITPPSLAQRLTVCVSLAGTAAFFERHGIVYLDWSFTNAFWSLQDHSAYVIDIDSCSFGPRRMIESHGWGDPLHPMGSTEGQPVDRYRVALLIARCITAERTDTDAVAAVTKLSRLVSIHPALQRVQVLVARAIQASRAADRPPLVSLLTAVQDAAHALDTDKTRAPDGVRAWTPIRAPGTAPRQGDLAQPRRLTQPRTAQPDSSHPRPFTPVPTSRRSTAGEGSTVSAVTLGVLGLLAVLVLLALV